jgi:hypothetical protein
MRLHKPTPQEVKSARLAAGLGLREAAELLGLANAAVFQKYESEGKAARAMDERSFALFRLLTGQHPSHHLEAGAGPHAAE